jgi:hypothetical protein
MVKIKCNAFYQAAANWPGTQLEAADRLRHNQPGQQPPEEMALATAYVPENAKLVYSIRNSDPETYWM